jgi:hypothetical protein
MDAGFTSKIRRLTLRHQNSRLALHISVTVVIEIAVAITRTRGTLLPAAEYPGSTSPIIY